MTDPRAVLHINALGWVRCFTFSVYLAHRCYKISCLVKSASLVHDNQHQARQPYSLEDRQAGYLSASADRRRSFARLARQLNRHAERQLRSPDKTPRTCTAQR